MEREYLLRWQAPNVDSLFLGSHIMSLNSIPDVFCELRSKSLGTSLKSFQAIRFA
jgi:hypothetical protein